MLDILRVRNNFDEDHDRRDGYLVWSDEWDFSGQAKPRTAKDKIKMNGISVREQAKASFDDLAEMQFGLDLKTCKPVSCGRLPCCAILKQANTDTRH